MTKHVISDGINDGSHFDIIGLFDKDELRKKIIDFLNSIKNATQKPFTDCAWNYNIDKKIYVRDIRPRIDWKISGSCNIYTFTFSKTYNVKVGSYRDGFHINFTRSDDYDIADFKFKKAVFGDINANSAFSKNSKNVPKLIMNVLQDIYNYLESKE